VPGKGRTRNKITGGIFFSAVIQGRDITVQLPHEITPALSGLPAASQAFTGRDKDLQALLDILNPRVARDGSDAIAPAVVTAVSGLAGIGKTELAVQAAHTALRLGWFPGGVLFVDLFGYDPNRSLEPGQALEGFLRALGIPGEHIPSAAQDRARLYSSVLDAYAQEGHRVLVLVDNASGAEQVGLLLPTDATCAAIVTSRHTLATLKGRLLELDILTAEASAAMLDQAMRAARTGDTRIADHPDDAATIARLCAGLPLALQIIAALLAEDPARPLAAMAADLQDEHTRLDELSYGDIAVRAAFDLSYQRLDPGHAWLFRMLPVNPGPDISTQAAAELTAQAQATTRRGLEALARAHLIERGIIYGRWRMHDLVRLFASERGLVTEQDDRAGGLTRLLQHYQATTDSASAYLNDTITDPASRGFPDRDSALTWLDAEYPNLLAVALAVADSSRHMKFAWELPLSMEPIIRWRRHYNDAVGLAASSLDAARRLADRHGEAWSLNFLGDALTEVRRFDEAISTEREAVQIYRELGDRHGEATTLAYIGAALTGAGRFDEGIDPYREALQIYRELGDRHGEAVMLDNVGITHRSAGRVVEAIGHCRGALQIYRELGNRHGEASALENLGSALEDNGRAYEAVHRCGEALQIYRELGDRHGEASALSNLGSALREAGRFKEAASACQDSAQIYRETGDQYREGQALIQLKYAHRHQRAKGSYLRRLTVALVRAPQDGPFEPGTVIHADLLAAEAEQPTAAFSTRARKARSLAKIRDPRAADLLAADAVDPAATHYERKWAMDALIKLGDPRGAALQADLLAVEAADPDLGFYTRMNAAKKLTELGDRRGTDQLATLATHSKAGAYSPRGAYSRREAAMTLAKRGDQRGADLLAAWAADPAAGPSDRRQAARYLIKLHDPRGTDLLSAARNADRATQLAEKSARPARSRTAFVARLLAMLEFVFPPVIGFIIGDAYASASDSRPGPVNWVGFGVSMILTAVVVLFFGILIGISLENVFVNYTGPTYSASLAFILIVVPVFSLLGYFVGPVLPGFPHTIGRDLWELLIWR
jgi:tetratricopeptide (TPR) repeat protein